MLAMPPGIGTTSGAQSALSNIGNQLSSALGVTINTQFVRSTTVAQGFSITANGTTTQQRTVTTPVTITSNW